MSGNKYCGNCKHFKDEDVEGWGWCSFNETKTHCTQSWDCHNSTFNGWTEITPENEHELTDELLNRIIIGFIDTHGRMHTMTLIDCHLGVGTMAKGGGYYYYILPEI